MTHANPPHHESAISWKKNPDDMAEIMARDYADFPICDMPLWLVKRCSEQWKSRQDIYFLKLENNNAYAGFVFGHTLGRKPWRRILRKDNWAIPFLAAIWLKAAIKRRFDRLFAKKRMGRNATQNRRFPHISEAPPDLASRSTPFAMLEFFFIRPDCRRQGLGRIIITLFEREAAASGAKATHAHISPWNAASISAFQNAGWNIYCENANSLRAVKRLAAPRETDERQ